MAELLAGRGEAEAERWTAMALEGPIDRAAAHDRVGAQFLNSNTPDPADPSHAIARKVLARMARGE